MIHFKYTGDPVGKGRPRITRKGTHVHTYTPEKTRMFEDAIRLEMMASTCEKMPVYEAGIPLKAEVVMAIKVPSSYSKKKKERCLSGEILPTKKPDVDNVLKAIFDALSGFAFVDDSQVIEIVAEKIYSETPFVDVTITQKDKAEQ